MVSRQSLGLGWKRYVKSRVQTGSLSQPNPEQINDFAPGYGIHIAYGAQWIQELSFEALNGERVVYNRHDLRDGRMIPCPAGFKRIWLTYKEDIFPKVNRIVFDVLVVPGMVFAATDGYEFSGGRRAFPSVLHHATGDADVVLAGAIGATVLLCDVRGDLYQGEDGTDLFPATSNPYWSSRFHGDDGAIWPSCGLYFDGFVSSSVAADTNWKLWILAYHQNGAAVSQWSIYRELTPAAAFAALPVGPVASGVITCRFENTGAVPLPLAIPPDGFQIWAENLNAVAKTLRGRIGGRTA